MAFDQTLVAETLFRDDRDQRSIAFGERLANGADIHDFTPADDGIYTGQRGQSVARHESVKCLFSCGPGNANQWLATLLMRSRRLLCSIFRRWTEAQYYSPRIGEQLIRFPGRSGHGFRAARSRIDSREFIHSRLNRFEFQFVAVIYR